MISIVTLAQGAISHYIRVAMDGIYQNAGGGIPPLPPMLGFSGTITQPGETVNAPVLPIADYDAFWHSFEQITLTDAEWESPATTLTAGVTPDTFFGDAAPHPSAARLALLEQQAAGPAQVADPAPAGPRCRRRLHPAAPVAAQRGVELRQGDRRRPAGGLFFWAPRRAEEGEPETMDRDKLAKLDEKLRGRRYKKLGRCDARLERPASGAMPARR